MIIQGLTYPRGVGTEWVRPTVGRRAVSSCRAGGRPGWTPDRLGGTGRSSPVGQCEIVQRHTYIQPLSTYISTYVHVRVSMCTCMRMNVPAHTQAADSAQTHLNITQYLRRYSAATTSVCKYVGMYVCTKVCCHRSKGGRLKWLYAESHHSHFHPLLNGCR